MNEKVTTLQGLTIVALLGLVMLCLYQAGKNKGTASCHPTATATASRINSQRVTK